MFVPPTMIKQKYIWQPLLLISDIIWMHPIIQQILNMYYDKLINFSCL